MWEMVFMVLDFDEQCLISLIPLSCLLGNNLSCFCVIRNEVTCALLFCLFNIGWEGFFMADALFLSCLQYSIWGSLPVVRFIVFPFFPVSGTPGVFIAGIS